MKNILSSEKLHFTQLKRNILINKANFIRLHLLEIVKKELEFKKLTPNNFFINKMKEKITEIEISNEFEKKPLKINLDSDDESFDDEGGNSSNDISCEEEEVYNFKKF